MEARLAGLDAGGIDLNPFAVLLARAKTTDYDLSTLLRQARQLRQFVNDLVRRGVEVPSPSFYNMDYWFKPEVQRDLALLRYGIERVIEPEERDFFWVAFAAAVREGSNTRRGEYKLHRMPEPALHAHSPKSLLLFGSGLNVICVDYKSSFGSENPTPAPKYMNAMCEQASPCQPIVWIS